MQVWDGEELLKTVLRSGGAIPSRISRTLTGALLRAGLSQPWAQGEWRLYENQREFGSLVANASQLGGSREPAGLPR